MNFFFKHGQLSTTEKPSTRIGLLLGVGILFAGATQLVTAGPAQSQTGAGVDYFVEQLQNPMDFSDQADAMTNIAPSEANFTGTTNMRIADGKLMFDAAGPWQWDIVHTGNPKGIPVNRDGFKNPIDTNVYSRLVANITAPGGAGLSVQWGDCQRTAAPELKLTCSVGGSTVQGVTEGAKTYDIPLGASETGGINWSGQKINSLRLTGTPGSYSVDWVRLVGAGTQNPTELTTGSGFDLIADAKAHLDFATAAGNPWDMDSMGDIAQVIGFQPGYKVENGMFYGCNVGTSTTIFPSLVFNMPKGAVIDAGKFKTLTYQYENLDLAGKQLPYSLKPGATSGIYGRVFWFDKQGKRHPTNSFSHYTNLNTVQVDLTDPTAQLQGIEAGKGVATGAPWQGDVVKIMLNPMDSKSPTCARIGKVSLTSSDPAGTAYTPTFGAQQAPTQANAGTPAKTKTATTKKTTTKKKK